MTTFLLYSIAVIHDKLCVKLIIALKGAVHWYCLYWEAMQSCMISKPVKSLM